MSSVVEATDYLGIDSWSDAAEESVVDDCVVGAAGSSEYSSLASSWCDVSVAAVLVAWVAGVG